MDIKIVPIYCEKKTAVNLGVQVAAGSSAFISLRFISGNRVAGSYGNSV